MRKIHIQIYLLISLTVAVILSFIPISIFAEDYDVRLYADRLIYDQKKKFILLEGNVRFHYKNTILSATLANFNTETRIGKMEGDVRIYQPGTTIVGDTMYVDYNKTFAKLSGKVQIVTVRDLQSSPGNQKELLTSGLTTMNCDNLDYNWALREGQASGNVFVEQKNRRAYADKAHYSQASELITLEGKVRFEQGSNDWITCDKAYIDMRKETFMAVGGVTGNFLVKGQEMAPEDKKSHKLPEDLIVVPELQYKEKKLPE